MMSNSTKTNVIHRSYKVILPAMMSDSIRTNVIYSNYISFTISLAYPSISGVNQTWTTNWTQI